jgi:acyl transferase domain-containing protein
VNNFGFGGTNAHVVLERGPRHDGEGMQNTDPLKRKLYIVSAHDKRAALQISKELAAYLDLNPPAFTDSLMDKIAFTLGQRRSFLPWRVAISASSYMVLNEYLSKDPEPIRSSREPSVGFVFTGQGAQWHGMGKELLGTYLVFQKTMQAVDTYLKTLGANFSITGMLTTLLRLYSHVLSLSKRSYC